MTQTFNDGKEGKQWFTIFNINMHWEENNLVSVKLLETYLLNLLKDHFVIKRRYLS